jgi:hypothetical protein
VQQPIRSHYATAFNLLQPAFADATSPKSHGQLCRPFQGLVKRDAVLPRAPLKSISRHPGLQSAVPFGDWAQHGL